MRRWTGRASFFTLAIAGTACVVKAEGETEASSETEASGETEASSETERRCATAPGRLHWNLLAPEVPLISFDLFIGADGRVLRWDHYSDAIEEVELLTPDYFDGCIAALPDLSSPACLLGEWFEPGATMVEPSCP